MMEGNEQLRMFVGWMEREMARIGAPPVTEDKAFLAYQKYQMEALVALEDEFRAELLKTDVGRLAYQGFMKHVQEGSILSARPFFRERQNVFSEHISGALTSGDLATVSHFRLNYRFVRFVMSKPWRCDRAWPKRYSQLARGIERLRNETLMLLMPLVISRVRIFWSRTPKSHLSFMDMIQLGSDGALAAIDKYVLPFHKNFRAVVIGRISGNLIEAYSETPIHFYPNDRRKIYRANKAVGRTVGGLDGVDYTQLADRVNVEAEGAFTTTPSELSNLMSAASCVSADGGPPGTKRAMGRLQAPEEQGPDQQVEQREALYLMHKAAKGLTLFERKLLVLRGILEIQEVSGGAG